MTASLSPFKAFAAAGATLGLAVALAEVYRAVAIAIAAGAGNGGGDTGDAWLAAALVHSVLALAVLGAYARRRELADLLSVAGVRGAAPAALARRPWLAYAPASAVLVGTLLLVGLSRQIGASSTHTGPVTPLAWLTWIPVIEELVFRAGFGRAFRRWLGPVWGGWFGAVLFALAHASPTWRHLIAGELGLPLGPFLLGIACELLFGWTGRLVPVVALHAACNATVVVFARGDERWLDWLSFLYG